MVFAIKRLYFIPVRLPADAIEARRLRRRVRGSGLEEAPFVAVQSVVLVADGRRPDVRQSRRLAAPLVLREFVRGLVPAALRDLDLGIGLELEEAPPAVLAEEHQPPRVVLAPPIAVGGAEFHVGEGALDVLDVLQVPSTRPRRRSSQHVQRGVARAAPYDICLLYTSPSPRDATLSRMPSSA